MFTGLIEEVGTVLRLERRGEGARLAVRARKVLEGTQVGDSIAVSGACLTVVELGGDRFVVDIMPETLARTTLQGARGGDVVNLERSLAFGDRLGGHLVLGHVDAVAEVKNVEHRGETWELSIGLPEELLGCVAPKGSIAVDGISLTVTHVENDLFGVGIIPHTMRETTLRAVKPGLAVNLEADVLARYVLQTVRTLGVGAGPGVRLDTILGGEPRVDQGKSSGGLTEEFLRGRGFL